MIQFSRLSLSWGLVLLIILGACGSSSEDDAVSADQLRVDLDKSQAQRLLRYYFGGFAAQGGADPFRRGLLTEQNRRFYIHLDSLGRRHPKAAQRLRREAGKDALNWEELAAFLQATYYSARDLPESRRQLLDSVGLPQDSSAWFGVELHGVMTSARRRVQVKESALRHALRQYHENDEELIYPVGTTIIGDHLQAGTRAETTVMRKRSDGFWDFFTYGPEGALASETQTPPRALKSPTQCVGCHLGTRHFEPEKSFPAEAPAGPHGPRALHVGDAFRDAEVVRFFQEHAKRSDMVLGLYNTLFVSKLRAQRRKETISREDRELLRALEI